MSMEQEILQRMYPFHKKHEGYRLDAYRCSEGFLSIGIGHNCDASPVPGVSKVGDRIDEEEIERLYERDRRKAIADLDKYFPWWRTLEAPRAAALFDMCFNMGIGWPKSARQPGRGLRSFSITLEHVRMGNYEKAAAGMMASKWSRQVGDGYGGRFDRAEAMAKQMETGVWAV